MKTLKIIFFLFGLTVFLSGCQNHEHDNSMATKPDTRYTCAMHPQIVADHPGSCPICKMDLVVVTATSSHQIMLNDSQVELANIKTEKVSIRPVGTTYVTNGRLVSNEAATERISVRVAGRIDKLFVKEIGAPITKGQPLYEIFSEPLVTLQQEYILSIEQFEQLGKSEPRFEEIMNAAEKKLLLFGLNKNQVSSIRENKRVLNRVTFYSPHAGYVTNLNVSEGEYVQEGQTLVEVANNNTLWAEAELYPSETALVRVGDTVEVRVSGFNSHVEKAAVSFLSPEFKSNTQISTLRASIPNRSGDYRPGMQLHVKFSASKRQAIAVPLDAVIRNDKGAHLYLKVGPNTFEPRIVKTGAENADVAEISEGLKEGDEVVISGAYLLYSELVLKKGGEMSLNHH